MDWRAMLDIGLKVLERITDREKMQRDLDGAFARIRTLEEKMSLLERHIGDAGAAGEGR